MGGLGSLLLLLFVFLVGLGFLSKRNLALLEPAESEALRLVSVSVVNSDLAGKGNSQLSYKTN